MKVSYKLSDPKKLNCTVTLTGPMEDFEFLAEKLADSWPSSSLRYALWQAINDANRTFYGESQNHDGTDNDKTTTGEETTQG